jgi:hypothetical protein
MQKNKRNVHDQRVTLMSLHLGVCNIEHGGLTRPKATSGVGARGRLFFLDSHTRPHHLILNSVKCERVRGGALHIFEIALYVLVCCE